MKISHVRVFESFGSFGLYGKAGDSKSNGTSGPIILFTPKTNDLLL